MFSTTRTLVSWLTVVLPRCTPMPTTLPTLWLNPLADKTLGTHAEPWTRASR